MKQKKPISHAGQKEVRPSLQDPFGRQVRYLRLSVTDRCDLRCRYCMAENMVFLPKKDLLTIEELYRLATVFISLGIKKIRITGGEPLMRRGIEALFFLLQPHLEAGLEEITLTTNGSQLKRHAAMLYSCGVRRINVSLDTLDPARYRQITRRGDINQVLHGLDAAQDAGLHVKINAVAMQGHFLHEVDDLIGFAHGRGMDLTLIEEMPLGETGHHRYQTHLSLAHLKENLSQRWTLLPVAPNLEELPRISGPARYMRVKETGGILGFITPISCDFCGNCNRVRVGSTGRLYPCMGHQGMVELRDILRRSAGDKAVMTAIYKAIATKPKGHEFIINKEHVYGISRHMSELGG